MPKCWAAQLGGCDSQSREHVISKSLFVSPQVRVHGFPWCKDEPKVIGIESATAKILCEHHNNTLSPLDEAASAAFDALREQTKLANDRAKFPQRTRFAVRRFPIKARLLERWLLKTLLNFSFDGPYLIGPSGVTQGIPPLDLLEICFRGASFPSQSGMYVAANLGMTITFEDTVAFAPLLKDERLILGGFFEFRGIRLFLALMHEGMTVPLWSLPNVQQGWTDANLLRPFKKTRATHGRYLSHVIEFDWR